MADHIPINDINLTSEIEIDPDFVDPNQEIKDGFAGQIFNHLRLSAMNGDGYDSTQLRGNDKKLHNIYQELKELRNKPNHQNWISTDSRSTLRSLFKKHNLVPEQVTHLVMTREEIANSSNFVDALTNGVLLMYG